MARSLQDLPESSYPLVWIFMGVSGSGKTSIARFLASKLECDFIEGDRRHPEANIRRMLSRQPLQDEDRDTWLGDLAAQAQIAVDHNRELVLTCSALKKKYRDRLAACGRVQFVLIDVPEDELARRLRARPKHYFTADLLPSQLAAFERPGPDENAIVLDGTCSQEEIKTRLWETIRSKWPQITQLEWWERK